VDSLVGDRSVDRAEGRWRTEMTDSDVGLGELLTSGSAEAL
jgi:hypothetical protein